MTPPQEWWLFILCLVWLISSGDYPVTIFDSWLALLVYIPLVLVGLGVAAGILSD